MLAIRTISGSLRASSPRPRAGAARARSAARRSRARSRSLSRAQQPLAEVVVDGGVGAAPDRPGERDGLTPQPAAAQQQLGRGADEGRLAASGRVDEAAREGLAQHAVDRRRRRAVAGAWTSPRGRARSSRAARRRSARRPARRRASKCSGAIAPAIAVALGRVRVEQRQRRVDAQAREAPLDPLEPLARRRRRGPTSAATVHQTSSPPAHERHLGHDQRARARTQTRAARRRRRARTRSRRRRPGRRRRAPPTARHARARPARASARAAAREALLAALLERDRATPSAGHRASARGRAARSTSTARPLRARPARRRSGRPRRQPPADRRDRRPSRRAARSARAGARRGRRVALRGARGGRRRGLAAPAPRPGLPRSPLRLRATSRHRDLAGAHHLDQPVGADEPLERLDLLGRRRSPRSSASASSSRRRAPRKISANSRISVRACDLGRDLEQRQLAGDRPRRLQVADLQHVDELVQLLGHLVDRVHGAVDASA